MPSRAILAEAEREGIERYPLYHWTKATIENPAKKTKYQKSFTLYVEGDEVYAKEKADALEADLQRLVGGKLAHATGQARHQSRQQPAAPGALPQVRPRSSARQCAEPKVQSGRTTHRRL